MTKKTSLKPYPYTVCYPCGIGASKGKCFPVSTYYPGKCDVCEKEASVTEARDFYYPEFKGHVYDKRKTSKKNSYQ